MTDIIISIIDFIAELVVTVFPSTDYIAHAAIDVYSGAQKLVTFLNDVNFIVPLADIFKIATLVITFTLSGFLLFVLNWVIRRVFDVIP